MKNWRNKLISLLLTLVMVVGMIPLTVIPAVAVSFSDWTKLNGSTTGQTLGANGTTSYYYITEDTTCTNSAVGGSGLTIASGATVYIYIPAGVTLNVKGGNGANAENGGASTAATFTYYTYHSSKPYDITNFPSAATLNTSGKGGNGATGGGAGIYVPANAKLVVYGDGTLNATGGNGGKAGNGAEGNNDLYWYITNYNPNTTGKEHTWYETNIPNCPVPVFTCSFYKGTWNRWSYAVTGAGGAGGGGAAGGGAAIGSSGASGNSGVAGANGRGAVTDGSSAIIRAVASENNTTAPSATSAGTVYIASSVKTTLIGGQGGAAGTRPAYVPNTSHSFREYGSGASYTTGNKYFNNSHGQSGGAGACGGKGASIGMGGGGGAGGAGGDSGEMIYSAATQPAVPNQGANGQVSGAVGAENANTTLSATEMVYCNIVMTNGTDTTYPVGVFGSFTVPAVDANGAAVIGWKVKTPAELLPTANGSSATSELAVVGKLLEANSTISTAEIIGDVELLPLNVTDWHLMNEKCDSYGGKGGLMGHQEKIKESGVGRTIIGLTEDMLEKITNGSKNLVIVGGDSGKQTTLSIDCAYTYFYDDNQIITAESVGVAAFVIIQDDKDGNPISGYGYYRLYNDSADEEHFMFDAMFKKPVNN